MSAAPASPALARVLKGDLCAGCGGCAAIAPGKVTMAASPDGFLRPRQTAPLDAAEEARIARSCPGLAVTLDAAGRPDDPMWGPVLASRAGHATDDGTRHRASSGGGLSALLVHLLSAGLVDRVIQIAADPALPIANRVVVSRTAEAAVEAAGSRYAPSAPLADLETELTAGGRAAFVGKPCDVAALRAMAQDDPRIDATIPYMLSFFCAGVPSLAGGRAMLAALGVTEGEVTAFRYRGHGWPGRATARLADGREASMTYAESWGNVLSKHLQLRCKICADGTGGHADAVCADAWACDDRGYPLFEERPGVSLILSRTEKGEQLVADAVAAGRVAAEPFDLAALAPIQPGQTNRKRHLAARLLGLALAGRPRPRYEGFHIVAVGRRTAFKSNLRACLGMMRRALFPKS